MKSSDIELSSISKNFEFEKLSRDVDEISDVKYLREMLKCYLKLYFKQQETIQSIGLMEFGFPRKEGEIRVGDEVTFIGGNKGTKKLGRL